MGGVREENPEFKDAFRHLLETSGGLEGSYLERISLKLRAHDETLTIGRLRRLLQGLPPSQAERRAISLVLEPAHQRWLSENWPLEDAGSRRLAKFAFARMKSHILAKEFVSFVREGARFRNENRSDDELVGLHTIFRDGSELEDEIDLFGL